MRSRLLYVTGMALFLLASDATAEEAETRQPSPYARAPGFGEGLSLYQLDIVPIELAPGVPYWAVEIRCVERCEHPVEYRDDDVPGPPIAAFQLGDGMPQFITLWSTASAYAVVIYDFGGDSVRKVLSAISRYPPQFVDLPDGSPDVVLNDFFSSIREVRISPGELWKWDGTEYVLDR